MDESLQGRAVQTSIFWHLEWNSASLTWTSEDGRLDLKTIPLMTDIQDALGETSRSAYFLQGLKEEQSGDWFHFRHLRFKCLRADKFHFW